MLVVFMGGYWRAVWSCMCVIDLQRKETILSSNCGNVSWAPVHLHLLAGTTKGNMIESAEDSGSGDRLETGRAGGVPRSAGMYRKAKRRDGTRVDKGKRRDDEVSLPAREG